MSRWIEQYLRPQILNYFKARSWVAKCTIRYYAAINSFYRLALPVVCFFAPKQWDVWHRRFRLDEAMPLLACARYQKAASVHTWQQWVPILNRGPAAVVVLDGPGSMRSDLVANLTCRKVVLRKFFEVSLFFWMNPSLQRAPVMFADTNVQGMQVIACHRHENIFVGHGESDKGMSSRPALHVFEKLLVSGAVAKQRLVNMGLDSNRVHVVGRPQAASPGPVVATSTRAKILYAPTYEGYLPEERYSSLLDFGHAILEGLVLRQDVELAVKFHPVTGLHDQRYLFLAKELRSLGASQGVTFIEPETDVRDVFSGTSLLLSDISSVANDFATSHRPVAYLIPRSVSGSLSDRFPATHNAPVYRCPQEVDWEDVVKLAQGGAVSVERRRTVGQLVSAAGFEAERLFWTALGWPMVGSESLTSSTDG